MKIVVTGAKGMLGRDFCEFLRQKNIIPIEWDLPEMDVTNVEQIISTINRVEPDIILHFAAYTDVDGAEKEQAKAYAVNTQGTWVLTIAAKATKATLLYMSTDYVFDGKKGSAYLESDNPNPINYYGVTKFLAERVIIQQLKKYFIVRTSWLYGKHGRNFVSTVLDIAKGKKSLEVVNDQVGSPTYTKDLCEPIFKLVNSEHYGIYHITNSGMCSWFSFANAIIKEAGLNNKILPITSDKINRPAKRPQYSVLENYNYEQIFKESLRPWNEALKDFLKEINNEI